MALHVTHAHSLVSLSGWIESDSCFRWTHLEDRALHLGLVVLAAHLYLEDLENQPTHDRYVKMMDLHLQKCFSSNTSLA